MSKDMDKTPALSVILGIGKPHKSESMHDDKEDDKSEIDMASEAILSALAKKDASSLTTALLSFLDCAEMESDQEEDSKE
jgi:hypothetical protein